MKRKAILIASHGAVLAAGIGIGAALGIYLLPILAAPPAPASAQLQSLAGSATWHTTLRRDLPGSDALHWGEGTVAVGPAHVSHQGRLAPGPAYRLYLVPSHVETGDDFLRVKAQALAVGDIRGFDGFVLPLPTGADPARYSSVVVWCEAFGRFITSGRYRAS